MKICVKSGMPYNYKHSIVMILNPKDNGGEHVEITVDVFNDYTNTHITTNCYGIVSTQISFHRIGLKQIAEAFNELHIKSLE